MIAQFAIRLACGLSFVWCLMPRKDVTEGFFRIQMLVAMALWVLAALAAGHPPMAIPCGVMAFLAFVGSALWRLDLRRAGTWLVLLIGFASLSLLVGIAVSADLATGQTQTARGMPALCSDVSASLLLGSTVAAMLLGHWYLTATTMSIEPLKRLNQFVAGSALLRLVVAGVATALTWHTLQGQTHRLWLVLRFLAGIAGPLVASVMVWRILRYRNTQSATGVLFAAVILVFIGEMTAMLLQLDLQRPF